MNLNDSLNNEYKLLLKCSTSTLTNSELKFQITKKPFKEINMFEYKNEYKNFGLDLIEFKSNEKGVRGNHLISIDIGRRLIDMYELEILHVLPRKWSSIRIKDLKNESKLYATSNLIGLEQLPSVTQLSKVKHDANKLSDSSTCIVLDDLYEKAMLVKNLQEKDFALVKAKWINRRNGVPGTPGKPGRRGSPGVRGKPGVPGQVGNLIVSIYLFKNKKTQIIEIKNDFLFNLQSVNMKITVDLKSGRMGFNKSNNNNASIDELEIESILATIFSIAILHVMLQPKSSTTSDKKNQQIDINNYYMLNTACDTNMFLAYNLAFALNYDGLINGGFVGDAGGCGGCGGFFSFIF